MNFSKQNGHAISILSKTEIHNVLLESILYIECDGTLIKIHHTESEKPYCCINTLKNLEAELTGFGFLRICHNKIVNMKNIICCNAVNRSLKVKNGIVLAISRRKWHRIKDFHKT